MSKIKNAVGIDIGGTTTAVAAVDAAGRIHARAEFETSDRFAPAIREQIVRATQIPKGRVEIAKAYLGNDAGVIGAACLAFQNPKRT